MDKSVLLAFKRKSKEVTIPDVGAVTVRELSLAKQIEINTYPKQPKEVSYWACLVCSCCFNAEGEPVFSLDDWPQVDLLPIEVISPLVLAAMEVNGIGPKAQEEARKN